jgi:hypothetical protein
MPSLTHETQPLKPAPRRGARPGGTWAHRAPAMLVLPRPLWLAIGLAAGVAAAAVASPWLLAAWLAPDLALPVGGLPPFDSEGRLKPAAVRAYNATHVLAGPLVLAIIGALTTPFVLALAALWLCHIGIDRALGYPPRNPDGSIRGG